MSHWGAPGQPGYPPVTGYPPQDMQYPGVGTAGATGYPPTQQPGYPPQQGYPQQGYPQQPGSTGQQGYSQQGLPAQQGYPGAPQHYQAASSHGAPGFPVATHTGAQGYPGPQGYQGAPGVGHGMPGQMPHAAGGHHQGAVGSGLPPPVPHGVTMGAVPRGTLVDQKYVTPTEITLVLKEHVDPRMQQMGKDSDDFSIIDSQGRLWFRQNASMMNSLEQRQILDSYGQPCVSIMKKPMSLHGGWLMYRGAAMGNEAARICEVQPKGMSMSPYCRIFLNDGDKVEDFYASGNFMAKKFEIGKKVNGNNVVWATVKKEGTYSSATAYLNSKAGAQSYYLQIKPNSDVAFVVAIAALLDEIYRDSNK